MKILLKFPEILHSHFLDSEIQEEKKLNCSLRVGNQGQNGQF